MGRVLRLPRKIEELFEAEIANSLVSKFDLSHDDFLVIGALALPRWFDSDVVSDLYETSNSDFTAKIRKFIEEVADTYGEGLLAFPQELRYFLMSWFFENFDDQSDKIFGNLLSHFAEKSGPQSALLDTNSASILDIEYLANRRLLYLVEYHFLNLFVENSKNMVLLLDGCLKLRREPNYDLSISRRSIKALNDHIRIGTSLTEAEMECYQFLKTVTPPWNKRAPERYKELSTYASRADVGEASKTFALLELARLELHENGAKAIPIISALSDRSINTALQYGDHYAAAEAHKLVGKAYLRGDRYQDAAVAFDRAAKEINNYENLTGLRCGFFSKSLIINQSEVLYYQDDLSGSASLAQKVIELADGDFDQRAIGLANKILARIAFRNGKFKEALNYVDHAVELLRREIDKLNFANALHVKVLILLKILESRSDGPEMPLWPERNEVERLIDQSNEVFESEDSQTGLANNLQARARLLIVVNEFEEAVDCIERVVMTRRRQEDLYGLGTALLVFFEAALAVRSRDDAVEALSEAIDVHLNIDGFERLRAVVINIRKRVPMTKVGFDSIVSEAVLRCSRRDLALP